MTSLSHVRWLRYCQKTIEIFLGLNPTIEGSYFLLLYRVEPKVSKIQIFSHDWANGSQLSLNRSEWNFPVKYRNYSPSSSLFQIWNIFYRFEVIVKNLSQPVKFWPNFRCFWRFSPRDGVRRILKLPDYSNYTRIHNSWKFCENRSGSFWEWTLNKKKKKKKEKK